MRCHYEVLEVPRDADELEIKTAYRKLALKWHPDKNLENVEFAKEQFQIVQQAYEVLSDRQERAWYDNHREQILRGSNSEFEDKSLDVFQYFTATCFKGYGDDKNGFYRVYRNVFEKLAQEDMDFMENKEEFCEIPDFGNSETDFEKVSDFYAYWLNYTTKKSYVWLDPYDIKDIRDRRYLKLVEKENKKIRQKAKKERNEEIRNLAAFVKKRDKRVVAQKKIQEQKLLDDKKKRESLSKQKRLERQKELKEAVNQPDWTKFDNVKSELEEIEKNLAEQFGEELSNSEDEEEYINDLYCIACSKLFKTPKAFQNHESSKKHKENIDLLRDEILDDESELKEEINDFSEHDQDSSIHESEEILSDEDALEDSKNKKKKKRQINLINKIEETEDDKHPFLEILSDNEDLDFSINKKQKKKNKKSKSKTNEANMPVEKIEVKANELFESINLKKKKDIKCKKENPIKDIPEDTDHNCITCKSNFPSKNKLFDHLKKTGHGVYIGSNVKNNKMKKSSLKDK